MTKVLAPGALDSSSLQIGGGAKVAPMARRKTPSELRGEQLRRSSLKDQANESFDVLLRGCKRTIETDNGIKKQEQLKNPKYIEMRMDELYPVKKARSWMLSGKENPKENNVKEKPSCLKNVTLISNVAANKRQHLVREQENAAAAEASDDAKVQAHQSIETCSQSRFRSVTELSTVGVKSSNLAAIDMNKALKALATCEPLLGRIGESSGKSDNPTPSGTFVSEFHVAGQNIPLDLSLKTCMRLVSTSPVNWLHRSIMCSTYNGMPQLKSRSGNAENYDTSSSGSTVVSQVLNSMALHSWVHPQSTLPPFIISALVASGQDMAEIDFLRDRQSAWEDSFRSLYFMFRKNLCNIFYVCTSQFVVMFTARGGNGGTKRLCSGYITQSTRRLRALLKELDICFSMPLCQSKMEQVTTEDLVELSEIEKHNLGQTRRRSSFSDIDNTPESLLAFIGNQSVHGLYDLLLNYRSSLGFLPTADVPVLYSPVPFQNAALSSPEIKCTEMVRMEHSGALPLKTPPGDHCCMVEVKGSYLPPWIISNMCAIVGSDGRDFEASFVTEQTSVGLNVALPEVSEKTDTEPRAEEGTLQINEAFGVHGATFCHQLRSGQLKSLKYCKQSYKVSLSPL